MNYFQTLPEELTQIILTYCEPVIIRQLSKELKLYLDYESLLRVKYPVNYVYIKYLIPPYEYEYYYNLLTEFGFNDDTETFLQGEIRL